MKLLTITVILAMFVASCDLFKTGNPEAPELDNSSYVPATSPQFLIANFRSAIQEKKVGNYVSCLADSTIGANTHTFEFIPSSMGNSQILDIFRNWDIAEESASFKAMLADLTEGSFPKLVLSNSNFDPSSSDSSVFISDYSLEILPKLSNSPKVFTGSLQITMHPNQVGIWCITRWGDLSVKLSDSTSGSWTLLKATYKF